MNARREGKPAVNPHPPVRRSSANPHYLEFRGRTGPLISSAEHYGALINLDFDYERYFAALGAEGFNQTRVFSGTYVESGHHCGIADNTLEPAPGRFLAPWTAGADGRYDLAAFSPGWTRRLQDLLRCAGRHGVVVELVLFCFYYTDAQWETSPLHPARNVNGVGLGADGKPVGRCDPYRLACTPLTEAQERFARHAVGTVAGFDNVYLEICNEPYSAHDGGAFEAFHRRIARAIREAGDAIGRRLLVAMNIANRGARAAGRLPAEAEIVNFHYADKAAVAANYALDLVLADDETGFCGQTPTPYRREAWEFLLAGGGIFSHLDYGFTVGHPAGDAPIGGVTPGYGGPEMRRQFGVLKRFLDGFDLARMQPHDECVANLLPPACAVTVLAEPGRQYAVYAWTGGNALPLALGLPAGRYRAEWISPVTGGTLRGEDFDHAGGSRGFWQVGHWSPCPGEDLAIAIRARD